MTNSEDDKTHSSYIPDEQTWDYQYEQEEIDIEYVSKSELKRDMKDIQKLGEQIIAMNAKQLKKLALSNDLQIEVEQAQKIKSHSERLRQIKRFGKLLRNIDLDDLQLRIAKINESESPTKEKSSEVEIWYTRFVDEGDSAIHIFCETFSYTERQTLRQLFRAHQKKPDATKTKQQLFAYIKSCIQE
ncbi:MAG: ribosome biogenesis factor YjgA [Pseudomonadota bacterium]